MSEGIVHQKILVIPIGAVDSYILTVIADAFEKTFHCKVETGREISIPEHSYNLERKQYHSTTLLKWMELLKSEDFDRVFGVTDVDLYVPYLNFVFGEADRFAKVAIISLIRLREEFYGLTQDESLFHLRAVKEAIHEIGHTYDLGHCPDSKYIMHFSNSLRDTDTKGPGFCKKCQSSLARLFKPSI